MNKITSETIQELLALESETPAVTMYIPTHRTVSSPTINEDQIRFKNLCRDAINKLEEQNADKAFVKQFVNECNKLLQSIKFWENLSDSLLICANPNGFKYYHLPIHSDPFVTVDTHFHITPVIGLLHELHSYYVLQVTQQNPQLFVGDMYELRPATLELPKDIKSALKIDELHQKSLQFSSVKSSVGAMYHGNGGKNDHDDDERMRFWKLVDGMICYDIDTDKPLILTGTDSEIAEYRSVSKHPNILKATIEHSKNKLPHVHEKAVQILRDEVIAERHQTEIERFVRSAAQQKEDLEEAAGSGRIDTLLIGMTLKTKDTVQNNKEPVTKLVFPEQNEAQTIDRLARKVLEKSGSIVNLFQNQMPEQKLMLAIHRY